MIYNCKIVYSHFPQIQVCCTISSVTCHLSCNFYNKRTGQALKEYVCKFMICIELITFKSNIKSNEFNFCPSFLLLLDFVFTHLWQFRVCRAKQKKTNFCAWQKCYCCAVCHCMDSLALAILTHQDAAIVISVMHFFQVQLWIKPQHTASTIQMIQQSSPHKSISLQPHLYSECKRGRPNNEHYKERVHGARQIKKKRN